MVSKKLLDDRIQQRSILRSLNRENEILDLLEADMLSGDKSDWDTINYYATAISDRTDYIESLPFSTAPGNCHHSSNQIP